jgi:hypothetical protein
LRQQLFEGKPLVFQAIILRMMHLLPLMCISKMVQHEICLAARNTRSKMLEVCDMFLRAITHFRWPRDGRPPVESEILDG